MFQRIIAAPLVLGLLGTGCYYSSCPTVPAYPASEPAYVQVATAPPPVKEEVAIPAKPTAGSVWVSGHWDWRGEWTWIHGHWEDPRPGYVWTAPVATSNPAGGYRYHPGYWRPSNAGQPTVYQQPGVVEVTVRGSAGGSAAIPTTQVPVQQPAPTATVQTRPAQPVATATVQARPATPVATATVQARPAQPVATATVHARPAVPATPATPARPTATATVRAQPAVPATPARPAVSASATVNARPTIAATPAQPAVSASANVRPTAPVAHARAQPAVPATPARPAVSASAQGHPSAAATRARPAISATPAVPASASVSATGSVNAHGHAQGRPAQAALQCQVNSSRAPAGGLITLTSNDFGSTPVVRIGGEVAPIVNRSRNQLRVQVPQHSGGGAVTVSSGGMEARCGNVSILR